MYMAGGNFILDWKMMKMKWSKKRLVISINRLIIAMEQVEKLSYLLAIVIDTSESCLQLCKKLYCSQWMVSTVSTVIAIHYQQETKIFCNE